MAALRRPLLVVAALFALGCGLRLLAVYPPTLRRDPATIALQACRILDGERPIFFSGQAWMGAAGTYVEALLFKVFGANTLTMSLYAWALCAIWVFLSLLLAWRLYGPRVAGWSAAIWLIPTPALLYWSCQARNDFQVLFIATPLILLLTHDLVLRFREGKGIAARAALLGFVCGFSFWQNMGIGPCLVVTFAIIALQLGRVFWTRFVWAYSPAWLLGFSPVLYYNLTTDLALTGQGSVKSTRHMAQAAHDLVTNALPYFWGMPLDGEPRSAWRRALVFFLLWTGVLLAAYAAMAWRKWRRREDLLPEQLVLGLLLFHLLVPTVTEYGKSFGTSGNPILFFTNLYSVAFLFPAVVLARLPGLPSVLAALPFLIYVGNNVRNTRNVPAAFVTALRTQGAAAIGRFPDPANPAIRHLAERGLTNGYLESPETNELNLAGLGSVEFSRPYQERVVEYSLRADAAKNFFWVDQDGLSEGLRMIGCEHDTSTGGERAIHFNFRKEPVRETLLSGYTVTASRDGAGAAALSDRTIDTAWALPEPLSGAWVRFDFPDETRVDRIVLLPRAQGTLPAHLIVQASGDGREWRTVGQWRRAGVFFWSVRHPFLKLVKPRCELALAQPATARSLRILVPVQTGSCALSEVYLYGGETPGATPPPVSVDAEVDAIAAALAPLKGTHRIAGDHYFMSLFKLAGFDVEFIPNRAVNNSGRRNPFLKAHLPLDFSRPLALIVPKANAPSVAERLQRGGVGFERRPLALHDLFVTAPAKAGPRLYWSGFDLLATTASPVADREPPGGL
ncbi:MAG TPA: discoidin domain-containing protein [bacterium]